MKNKLIAAVILMTAVTANAGICKITYKYGKKAVVGTYHVGKKIIY